jgi:hypothetical protein
MFLKHGYGTLPIAKYKMSAIIYKNISKGTVVAKRSWWSIHVYPPHIDCTKIKTPKKTEIASHPIKESLII